MEQLQVFEQNGELYTDSRDVAEMIADKLKEGVLNANPRRADKNTR